MVIKNEAAVLAIVLGILYFVFYTHGLQTKFWQRFYKFAPPILLCYFLPGILNTFGIISGEESSLYPIVSKFLLPPCLILFTLGLDIEMLKKLGSKAILVFLAGTAGVVFGGPLAVLLIKYIHPSAFATENQEAWRGLATIAGSWIGGGANQTALKEVFQPSAFLFSQAVAVDIIVAETWLAFLLFGIVKKQKINKWLGADTSLVDDIREKMEQEQKELSSSVLSFEEVLKACFIAFGISGIAYLIADGVVPWIEKEYPFLATYSLTSTFFWVVLLSTTFAIFLSQTTWRKVVHRGGNLIATLFLYLLIATIGMQMDLFAIAKNPALILVGVVWIFIHGIVIFAVAKMVKAPFFFVAVGSQANVGGAASASVVAAAYHPSLISVGVILSVFGYALGTYLGYITTLLMKWAMM